MGAAMLVAGRLMAPRRRAHRCSSSACPAASSRSTTRSTSRRTRAPAPSCGSASCRASGSASCSCRSTRSRWPRSRPALRTQGTAMWTLIRNLGSSIGVSIVIANLTNKTIMMHARLAESVTPFNQAMADPAAAMLDPSTDTGPRAAREPHHPAGDHHRLRQRLQADDDRDPAGLPADPADPHQPLRLRAVAVRGSRGQTPRLHVSASSKRSGEGSDPRSQLNTPACGSTTWSIASPLRCAAIWRSV